MRLSGKVAVVTGAAGGIGRAVVERFGEEGAAVACVDRDERVNDVAARVREAGGTAVAVVADVSTDEGNERSVATAVDAFGGLDVFHANAAVQIMGRLDQTTPEEWERLYRANLYGVAAGLRAALPALRARARRRLVDRHRFPAWHRRRSRPAGVRRDEGGLRALVRSLATAHGPERIRVNAICPGDVETPILAEFFAFQDDPEAARREIVERYPLRRFASPRDVANLALFLASDESSYFTGTDLVIDGGLLARIY
jgi:NAD(P)-dependent dehydrogenase (short-subunit alcohol dehydrogenase family)